MITVELPTEEEARDYLYELITEILKMDGEEMLQDISRLSLALYDNVYWYCDGGDSPEQAAYEAALNAIILWYMDDVMDEIAESIEVPA